MRTAFKYFSPSKKPINARPKVQYLKEDEDINLEIDNEINIILGNKLSKLLDTSKMDSPVKYVNESLDSNPYLG